MGLRCHAGPIAADEAPQRLGIRGVRRGDQRQQHGKGRWIVGLRRRAIVNVPDRIAELLLQALPRIGVEELQIVVDMPRDDIEIKPLRRLRLRYIKSDRLSGLA